VSKRLDGCYRSGRTRAPDHWRKIKSWTESSLIPEAGCSVVSSLNSLVFAIFMARMPRSRRAVAQTTMSQNAASCSARDLVVPRTSP